MRFLGSILVDRAHVPRTDAEAEYAAYQAAWSVTQALEAGNTDLATEISLAFPGPVIERGLSTVIALLLDKPPGARRDGRLLVWRCGLGRGARHPRTRPIRRQGGTGMTTQEQIAEQDRNAREQLQRRLTAEAEYSAAEAEKQILEGLRQGGSTSRQRAAEELLSSLHALGRGTWTPSAQVSVTWGTAVERASTAVNKAVRDAVHAALQPFIDATEGELKAADEERDRIIETGRLS